LIAGDGTATGEGEGTAAGEIAAAGEAAGDPAGFGDAAAAKVGAVVGAAAGAAVGVGGACEHPATAAVRTATARYAQRLDTRAKRKSLLFIQMSILFDPNLKAFTSSRKLARG
jgi:hypothetical protein